jgi:HD-GYP domain-containing protein (c-di-GMP phosphodiesterase class II)
LSRLLQQQAVTPGAQLAIFDVEGRVVAYHDPARLAGASPTASAALPSAREVGATALAAMQDRHLAGDAVRGASDAGAAGGAVLREVDGRAWFYRRDLVSDAAAQPLVLAIAAPRQELLADAIQAQRRALVVGLLALCLMVPVVLLVVRAVSRPLRFLARDAEAIERFDFAGADHPGSRIAEVDELARAMRSMKHTLRRLLEISSALAAEGRFDRLLDRVLSETMAASRARGGQIHLLDADGRRLEAAAVRNDDAAGDPSVLPPLDLADADLLSPALQAARTQRTVPMDLSRDVPAQGRAASHVFDRLGVGRVQALAVPLRNRRKQLVGTLELHFTEAAGDAEWHIDPARVAFIEALSGTAAVAIDNQRLLMAQKALLQSFIELVAGAIDSKSPYTGGHCQRVPELARMLAEAACDQREGPFADYRLSEEQWEELHIAAWLHDCGKVTTPEYVVDKATKLETLCDRLHEVRTRFEVLKRDAEIGLCREALATAGVATTALDAALAQAHAVLDEEFAFVASCNQGGEFMDPARIERLRRIGSRTWLRTLDDRIGLSHEELQRKAVTPPAPLPAVEALLADKPEHRLPRSERDRLDPDNPWGFRVDPPEYLYDRGELHNLSIARGTLSDEERHKINDHMVQTIRMLAQLPFPRHLRNVPEIAGGHHEKMDGSGYPRRLKREQLSVSARMMAVADVFEALTAADRPYKPGKRLSESLQIMARMAQTGHIDAEVFELFLRAGVHLRYARRFMRPEQVDEVDIEALLPRAAA